jgi:transposase-like protein
MPNNPITNTVSKDISLNTKTNQLLAKSIKSLRQNLTEITLDHFLKTTLETVMQIERDEYLDKINNPTIDKGNGYYSRAFNNLSKNSMLINVPRTRTGGLSLNTLELLKINREKLDEITLSLYRKGLTFADIQSFLTEVFDHSVSPTTISELTKTFHKFRISWNESKLETHYKVVFADVIFVTVKRGDSYSKEGIFVAIGLRQDNKRELLVLDINPTESAKIWYEFLTDLKYKRGVERIDLFVADGLNYLEDELAKVYPQSEFQKCVVHKMRNVLNKTKPKDKPIVAQDLKQVFDNFESTDTIPKAKKKMSLFLEKWQKIYPSFKNQFKEGNIEYYFSYIKYSPRVRRMIYTTNSIENLNRQIRKATKNKLSFESPENLLDYLFMVIKDFEERNYMKYPVSEYRYFEKYHTKENQNQNQNQLSPDTI